MGYRYIDDRFKYIYYIIIELKIIFEHANGLTIIIALSILQLYYNYYRVHEQ